MTEQLVRGFPLHTQLGPVIADVAAEAAALGAILLKATVAEEIFGIAPLESFHDPRHAALARLLADMLEADMPADDPQVVVTEAIRRGMLGQIGGGPFIFDIQAHALPANGPYYARRVRDMWIRRTAYDAAMRVVAKTTDEAQADTSEVMAVLAEAADSVMELYEAQRAGALPDFAEFMSVEERYDWVIPGLLERLNRLVLTGFEGHGKALALDTPVPTPKGWSTMGELSVGDEVFGPDGVPTRVIAATDVMRGRPCYRMVFSDGAEVVADAEHLWLTDTLKSREANAKVLRRGPTKPRGTNQQHKRLNFPAVVTTEEIAATVWARSGHALNHSVPVAAPLQYPAQELPIAPYTLGAWLGDGTTLAASITCADEDIVAAIRADGYGVTHVGGRLRYRIDNGPERARRLALGNDLVNEGMGVVRAARQVGVGKDALASVAGARPSGWTVRYAPDQPLLGPFKTVQELLRDLGVLGDKHVPPAYQIASVDQRLALLQGLMDTDGTVNVGGAGRGRGHGAPICEFSVINERLARDVYELLLGLGIKVTFTSGPAKLNGREVGTRYRLAFQTELPVFRLKRKADRLTPLRTARAKLRYVKAVAPIPSVPVRCIQVERQDGMFVVSRACIPTHNSTLFRQISACAAQGIHPFTEQPIPRQRVLVIDAENTDEQIRRAFAPIILRLRRVLGREALDWAGFHVLSRPDGLDLLHGEDMAWVDRTVRAARPDIVAIGPIYQLHNESPNDEQAAKKLVAFLNRLRVRHNCALLLEAHAGNAEDSRGNRKMRPIGASLYRRFPEFGLGMHPAKDTETLEDGTPLVMELVRWRGDRERRSWPFKIMRGGEDKLPWINYREPQTYGAGMHWLDRTGDES